MSKIEDKVAEKILARAQIGLSKYGQTMERQDFSPLRWLQELQAELMDGAVYSERLMELFELISDMDIDTVIHAIKRIKEESKAS